VVDAAGDGIDANGTIDMTGGTVIVNGPTEQMNSALDYDGSFTLSGGVLVAVGSAGMAQGPTDTSSQPSLLLNFDAMLQAGTLLHIESSAGGDILTFAPSKAYQSIVFSSPELVSGASYNVFYGGSASGTATNGLYQDGAPDPGTQYTSFTVSSAVTRIGGAGGGMRLR
jgi:hypothetical protein